MALSAKVIKQKMKSVGNIKKITRTMEMVSVSKMKKATASASVISRYNNELHNVLAHISQKAQGEHKYFTAKGTGRVCLVIVSSNKGLAGGYNTNLYKKTLEYISTNNLDTSTIDAVTIGKQSEKITRRLKINAVASFIHISDTPTIDEGDDVFSVVHNLWNEGAYKSIDIISTHYVRAGVYGPQIDRMFPLKVSTQELSPKETIFEPSQASILDAVIPRLLAIKMYSVLTFAAASEHSSRMVAMKTASDNAGELQRDLTISYNKARQDAVTQELAEISAASLL